MSALRIRDCHPSLRSEAVYGAKNLNAEWGICCLSVRTKQQIPRVRRGGREG